MCNNCIIEWTSLDIEYISQDSALTSQDHRIYITGYNIYNKILHIINIIWYRTYITRYRIHMTRFSNKATFYTPYPRDSSLRSLNKNYNKILSDTFSTDVLIITYDWTVFEMIG